MSLLGRNPSNARLGRPPSTRDRSPLSETAPNSRYERSRFSMVPHSTGGAAGAAQTLFNPNNRPAMSAPPRRLNSSDTTRPPVCDIIIKPSQRYYGESIRQQLSDAGVIAQLKFLPSLDGVYAAVEETSMKGLLYACIASEENEIHRSITVHILYGVSQEHRNMPLYDAVSLIARNFDQYLFDNEMPDINLHQQPSQHPSQHPPQPSSHQPPQKQLPPQQASVSQAGSFKLADQNVRYLLQLTLDNKYLTVEELDQILDYFEDRRGQLAQSHGLQSRHPPPAPVQKPVLETAQPVPKVKSLEEQQNELQEKIFRMLKGELDPSQLGDLIESLDAPAPPVVNKVETHTAKGVADLVQKDPSSVQLAMSILNSLGLGQSGSGTGNYNHSGSSSYGQSGSSNYGQSGSSNYGQSGSSNYGQPGSSNYGQSGSMNLNYSKSVPKSGMSNHGASLLGESPAGASLLGASPAAASLLGASPAGVSLLGASPARANQKLPSWGSFS